MTGAACWSHPGYEAIARLIAGRTGLFFSDARSNEVERQVDERMKDLNLRNRAEYLEMLRSEEPRLDDLVDRLTVGETYFFREPNQFRFVRTKVLPRLRQMRPADHVFRVWSAGCASGEEAYSLAILLEEEGLGERSSIIATDLARSSLKKAHEARYGQWALRGCDDDLIRRYFRKDGKRWVLDPRIRRRVEFLFQNLARDAYPSLGSRIWGMDLIFCRNVLIYFDGPTISKIAQRLFGALAEGGWIITGPSDPPLQQYAPFNAVMTDLGVFLRRRDERRPGHTTIYMPEPRPTTEIVPPRRPTTVVDPPRPAEPDPVAEAQAAFGRGDYEAVVSLTAVGPDDPSVRALYVRALANLGRLSEAEKAAAEAAAAHPLCAELHLLRGVILLGLDRNEESIRSLKRVVYLDRSLAVAHFMLASVLQKVGDWEGALRAYRNARDLCLVKRPDEVVPLSDGERAGSLVEAATAQLQILEAEPR